MNRKPYAILFCSFQLLDSGHLPGIRTPPWNQDTSLESGHLPGIRTSPWNQDTSLKSGHLPGIRTSPWTQDTSLKSGHLPEIRTPPWYQDISLESGHLPGIRIPHKSNNVWITYKEYPLYVSTTVISPPEDLSGHDKTRSLCLNLHIASQ